jgi:predicted HD superfamily hydrolase involved in NAD metabolism
MESKIKGMLKPERFIHCEGTAKMAVIIAEKYSLDKRKAAVAGILHDCARELGASKAGYYIKKYKIKFDPVTKKIPELWHSLIGPYAAFEEFNIKDREILEAIKFHTAGNMHMGPIAKVLYIADYAEGHRKYYSSKKIRAKIITKISLDELLRLVLKYKLSYLIEEGKLIHKNSVDMWNVFNNI